MYHYHLKPLQILVLLTRVSHDVSLTIFTLQGCIVSDGFPEVIPPAAHWVAKTNSLSSIMSFQLENSSYWKFTSTSLTSQLLMFFQTLQGCSRTVSTFQVARAIRWKWSCHGIGAKSHILGYLTMFESHHLGVAHQWFLTPSICTVLKDDWPNSLVGGEQNQVSVSPQFGSTRYGCGRKLLS